DPLDRGWAGAVPAASIVDGIDLRMIRAAAISGHIVDDAGDPIVGAHVTAGRIIRTEGRSRLVSGGTGGDTDDLGEYRIGGLSAGGYVVGVASSVAARGGQVQMSGGAPFFLGGVVPPGGGVARAGHPGTSRRSPAPPVAGSGR